jgi:hypothetical protein
MHHDQVAATRPRQCLSADRDPDPWLKLDYGFIYLKNRMLSPAAERFMKIVREIETDLTVRNCELIDRIFSSTKGA